MAEIAAPPSAPSEDIAHDDLCPICQLLLFTPVRTQCNHLLCASCMAQWADASSTNEIEASSFDVELTDFDPNYDPSYDLAANCPMCRTKTTAAPDTLLATELERKYPATYAERRVEEEVQKGSRIGVDGVEGVMILIGNKHKLVRSPGDANQHDWTFFVRTSRPELVKEVRIDLHPTFRPPRLTLRNPPYEVRRLGWGYFTIDAEIILKDGYSWIVDTVGTRKPGLELSWTLNFERGGKQGRVRAKVKHSPEPEGRRLRARQPVVHTPIRDDDDDEMDDDNFETTEDEESSEENEDDEGVSEYAHTSRR